MNLLATLRARAGTVLARTSPAPAPPVAAHAAAPQTSRLGAFPHVAAGPGPAVAEPPADWGTCPESGQALPTGPMVQVEPRAWQAARLAHRHGWFASLAFRAAQGDADAAARAIAAMDGWLRQDIPGHGIAWAHASDLAARLVHWQAGLALLGDRVPATLREAMAGSAVWHLDHLDARSPRSPTDGLRRVLHAAGRVIGGFTFPDLESARDAWSEGLTDLKDDLASVAHEDGSPIDVAPHAYAEALWFVALARATARANGAAVPAAVDAALARGARFCERMAGQAGLLPRFGERFVGSALDADYPLAWSLWNHVVAAGLDAGEMAPRPGDDPRLALLGLAPGAEPPALGTKGWSMWVWRGGGWVTSEMRIKNRPSRAVFHMGTTGRGAPLTHGAPFALVWDIGELSVLADPGGALDHPELADWIVSGAAHTGLTFDGRTLPAPTEMEIELARVDGKKARARAAHDGWKKVGVPVTHQREYMLNQARLVVIDKLVPARASIGRHAVQLLFQLGPGWTVEPDEKGWLAKQANVSVLIQLDDALSWTLAEGRGTPAPAGWVGRTPAPAFIGSGGVEGAATFTCSFEVR